MVNVPGGILCILIVGLVGCAADSLPARQSVEDRNGVRYVRNTGSSTARSGWSLSTRPAYRIGRREGEPTFEMVRDGFLRADGSAVVADLNAGYVYVLDPDGAVRSRFGGRGEGPGEFTALASVVDGGEGTILTQDGDGRATWFEDGVVLQSARTTRPWTAGSSVLEFEAMLPGGDVVGVPGPARAARVSQEAWARGPVLRWRSGFDVADTLLIVDHVLELPPTDRNPIRYFGTVDVAGDVLVYARNDEPSIEWRDLAGELVQASTWDAPPRQVDEQDWEEYVDAVRSGGGGREVNDERLEEMLRETRDDFRGRVPLFRVMLADALGNVWLSEYTWVGAQAEFFNVVTRDGRWLGRVDMPQGVLPLDISGSRLLGVETDEYGVQAVVVYEITKPMD